MWLFLSIYRLPRAQPLHRLLENRRSGALKLGGNLRREGLSKSDEQDILDALNRYADRLPDEAGK